jgi:protein TonB
MHLIILVIGGFVFMKPVEFGVDQGLSGMEVQLVAGSDEAVAAVPEAVKEVPQSDPQPVVPDPESVVKPQEIPQPQKSSTLGNSDINAVSTGQGAIVEADPVYLKNPAPKYPYKARQNGWEGLVLLKALVDKEGSPVKVEIEATSGHEVLDAAALKTVKTWKFRPAHVGNLAVDSSVRVPVRFELKDAK